MRPLNMRLLNMRPVNRLAAAVSLAVLSPALLSAGPAAAASAVVGGERLAAPGVQVAPLTGAPALPPALTGRSWLVADAGSGEVLAAFNAHAQLPPASTLKMLFADTVLPKLDKATVHHVTPADLAGMGQGSSLVGVKEDLDYKVEDLWRGVFLSSGNDAVHVLAHMNGGVEPTVAQMQAEAARLQAGDTHVVTPDGYDEDGQLSSAYDLTLFAREGLRNPDFRAYCSTKTAQFPGVVDPATGQRGSFGISNTDRLLGRYPGLIGVKNGYTTNAGATYTGAAERGGRTLLVTVMHPAAGGMKVYEEAAALLDWGFAAEGRVTPVGQLVEAEVAATPGPGDAQLPQAAPVKAHRGGSAAVWWTAAGLCAALAAAVTGLRIRAAHRRTRAADAQLPPDADAHAGATAIRGR